MKKIEETLKHLNDRINDFKPEIGIILGSGLGVFCDNLKGTSIKYSDIPNFPTAGILGHKGELLYSNVEGKNCAIMQGRFHYYEGNSMQDITFPIKVLKMAGIKTLIITNAAGGINKNFNVGDIMLINDHINFMGSNPLIGKNNEALGERFPDMSNVYDADLRKTTKKCAKDLNINLKEGVYIATTGPSYETAAEIKAFSIMGADAVGMSSVPEAIVSNYLKIKTIGFSLITNHATGTSDSKLSHDEVLETGKKAGLKLSSLIKKVISEI